MNSFNEHFALFRSSVPAIRRLSVSAPGEGSSSAQLLRLSESAGELLQEPVASGDVVEQARIGYFATTNLEEFPDHWDERSEILSLFAFIAWRHSLALGDWDGAFGWHERFRESILAAQIEPDISEVGSARSVSDSQGASYDSFELLRTTVQLVRLNNEHPREGAARSAIIHKALLSHEWPVLSLEERKAVLFGLDLVHAMALRIGGNANGAAAILKRMRSDSGAFASALCERPEYESEAIALGATSFGTFSEGLARSFLARWNGPQWKREQVKVRLALALQLVIKGRYAEAIEALGAVIGDPWMAGEPEFWLVAREVMCDALLHCGHTTRALSHFRRAARLSKGLRDSALTRCFEVYRADTLMSLGRLAEAATVLDFAAERFGQHGELGWRGYSRLLLGEVLKDLGDEKRARSTLELAITDLLEAGRYAEVCAAKQLLAALRSSRQAGRD
jgi:tetratricopeptide (TPR) repeat protein